MITRIRVRCSPDVSTSDMGHYLGVLSKMGKRKTTDWVSLTDTELSTLKADFKGRFDTFTSTSPELHA